MGATRDVLVAAASANDEIAEALGGIDKLFADLGFNLAVPKNAAWLQNAMRGGMVDALAKLDGLACALRAARSGLPDPPDDGDLHYVADQRALRVVVIAGGRALPTSASIGVSSIESREIDRLAKVWVDGFNFGLRQAGGSLHRYTTRGN